MSKGHPISLLKEIDDTYVLNTDALSELLESEIIRDKPVIVISIAGRKRRGKSFMLNFFLKYLQAENKHNWLGDSNEPLNGFSWKNGPDCDTTGILIWSEPHLMTFSNGIEYAILLMDTQGTFDKKSTMEKDAMVFALSTMISSMQIYNIQSPICEDSLEFLSVFINYGRLAMESEDSAKPFQHLQFLVRDWSSPYRYNYGMEGGQQYLDEFLTYDENDNAQIRNVRQFIQQCFSRIDCCLMPIPGLKVMSNEIFDGKLSEIENAFVGNLRIYVPHLLSEEYLLPKRIKGSNITCLELLVYFKVYFRAFNNGDLEAPSGLFDATAEASNWASIEICKRFYMDEMKKVLSPTSKFLTEDELFVEHKKIFSASIVKFKERKKFGSAEISEKYCLKLKEELEERFKAYKNENELKRKANNTVLGIDVKTAIKGGIALVTGSSMAMIAGAVVSWVTPSIAVAASITTSVGIFAGILAFIIKSK